MYMYRCNVLCVYPIAEPGNVTGIMTNVTSNVVMVSWDPLPEDQWNGLPLGYYVSDYLNVPLMLARIK